MAIIDGFGYPKIKQVTESADDPDYKGCEFCGYPNSVKNDQVCQKCGSPDWKHYGKSV